MADTQKTRKLALAVMEKVINEKYDEVNAILFEYLGKRKCECYGASTTGTSAEAVATAVPTVSLVANLEWQRKCDEAVKNGAVIKGDPGPDQRICYYDSDGKPHRDDGPWREDKDGFQEWGTHGLLNNVDGKPSIVWPGHYTVWYVNGTCHREDGPAVIHASGTNEYWLNGDVVTGLPTNKGDVWDVKCLKAVVNGAVIKDGHVEYLNKEFKLHNETGPAREYNNGTREYWVNGTHLATTKSG